MLLLLACLVHPTKVDGDAIEIGADDPVWDPQSLPIYRLTLDSDWKQQLEDAIPEDACEDRQSILGSLDYENPQSGKTEHYDGVGVRYRGHSALSDGQRFGFKLLFDETDPEARFHDQKHISLEGTEGDFTLMRQRFAMGLVEKAGVPAVRMIHARLFVNDEFQGIFPLSEEPDQQPFIDEHFSKESGHLYKVSGYCGGSATFEYIGDDPADYQKRYEPKAGTLPEDAATDLIPLLQCVAGDDEALQLCLPNWLDLDEWLSEMAVDAVLPDVDGLAGAGQNFLMYHDPSSDHFVAYPYDKDQSFYDNSLESDSIFDFHPPWGEAPDLTLRMRRLWKDDYCKKVRDVLEDYAEVPAEVDRLQEFLTPYIATDPFLDPADWAGQVASIKTVVNARLESVQAQAEGCAP